MASVTWLGPDRRGRLCSQGQSWLWQQARKGRSQRLCFYPRHLDGSTLSVWDPCPSSTPRYRRRGYMNLKQAKVIPHPPLNSKAPLPTSGGPPLCPPWCRTGHRENPGQAGHIPIVTEFCVVLWPFAFFHYYHFIFILFPPPKASPRFSTTTTSTPNE